MHSAGSANRPPATQSPALSPTLRSNRQAAAGNSGPAPDSAAPSASRTERTALQRRYRSRPPPESGSGVRRTDAHRAVPDPPLPPTANVATRRRGPSPIPMTASVGRAIGYVDPWWADLHHGPLRHRPGTAAATTRIFAPICGPSDNCKSCRRRTPHGFMSCP